MREVKRARRPARPAEPRRAAHRRPRRAPRATSRSRPTVEPEVDRCVECGYCEPVCPSKDLTLTPRAAHRAAPRDRAAEAAGRHRAGRASCSRTTTTTASTPAPSTACARPRARCSSTPATWCGGCAPRTRTRVEQAALEGRGASTGTRVSRARRRRAHRRATPCPPRCRAAPPTRRARCSATDTVPRYSDGPPGGRTQRARPSPRPTPVAVYFSACTGTMFGPADGGAGVRRGVPAAVRARRRRARHARRPRRRCAAARRGSRRASPTATR